MTKKFTLLTVMVAVFFAVNLKAQSTLTASNFNPTTGDVVVLAFADTNNVKEGNAGANVAYDFSTLQKMGNNVSYTYVAPSTTPYASQYSASNLAYSTSSNQGSAGYVYLNFSATAYQNIGVATSTLQMVYSNPQTVLEYPTTYNSTFTDTHKGSGTNSQNITTYRSGTTTSTADGWGSLKLPQGTFSNVIRVKVVQKVRDSIHFMGNDIITDSEIETYNFFKEGIKQQLLGISYTKGKDFFGDDVIIKSVLYYPDAPNSVNTITKVNNFNVYPNPAASTVFIDSKGNNNITNYTVTDMLGKTLVNQPIDYSNNATTIDVSGLPQGIYVVSVFNNKSLVGMQKLNIAK